MSKVILTSLSHDRKEEKETKFPNPIKHASFSYDGRELVIGINGAIVLTTVLAGTDFRVDIVEDPLCP